MSSSSVGSTLLGIGLAFVSALGMAPLREKLADAHRTVQQREDVQVLPSGEVAMLASLGYRAALADLIFAHVLVSYGLHFQEKRRFELVAEYLDTVMTLDPGFREPARLADTLITLQPKPARLQDYRAARRLQDRGLSEFPLDSELWLIAGQFSAYLASPHVPESEQAAWRLDGARKLARSCELVGQNQNIPHHCITAALLYDEAGNRDAVKRFLERVLAVSDDPEIREVAASYLGRAVGEGERERVEGRAQRFRTLWADDLTFVSMDLLLTLSPRFDAALCAGRDRPQEGCFTSYRAWGAGVADEP